MTTTPTTPSPWMSNPSDVRQAAIGFGMSVFTRYSGVVNADGSRMTVRDALVEISRLTDEMLDDQLADMDAVTRWVVQWLEMHGTGWGPSGEADQLAQTKGIVIQSPDMEAVVIAKGGRVRTRTLEEFLEHRPPADLPMSRYAMGRLLIVGMMVEGEAGAAAVLRDIDPRDWHPIPVLASRIVRISEPPVKAISAGEAHPWHALASSWPEIQRLAHQ